MMYLQKILGFILLGIGFRCGSPVLLFIGIFLIFTKYDWTSLKYGDPRR